MTRQPYPAAIRKGVAASAVRATPRLVVAVYTRVSTAEQAEGHSLESQREACLAFVTALGGEVVEVYEDAGFSATSTDRPAFQRMLADAAEAKFGAIVFLKFDRFARSLEDWVVEKRALERKGIRVLSVTEPIEDNPMAPVMEALYGGMAEYYSRDLSAKVGRGLRKRAEKGLLNGMPPFGYGKSPDSTHEPPLIIVEEAEAVRWAFLTFAGGATMVSIAAGLNARGLRTRYRARRGSTELPGRAWTSASVSAMLGNATYAGYISHRGEVLGRGGHEAIVDEDLFQQVQRTRGCARGRPPAPQQHLYLLRGIARCSACGTTLHGNRNGVGKRFPYYTENARRRGIECSAPQTSVRADWLEGEIDAIVRRMKMPPEVRRRVLDLLAGDPREDVEARRARLTERLRRMTRAYTDLEMDEGAYDTQRRAIEAELDRLTLPTERAVAAAETFDVLQRAWGKATPQERRTIVLALVEAVYIDLATKTIADVVVAAPFRPWLSDWRA